MTLIDVAKGSDCQIIGRVTSEMENHSFCSRGEHSCVMESCIRAKNNLHDVGAGVGCILAEKVEAEEE